MKIPFSAPNQAHDSKPDLAHTGHHQAAGRAGMMLSFPGKPIPSRSHCIQSTPMEGFCFDNMPFSREKYFYLQALHPVWPQSDNVNVDLHPQGLEDVCAVPGCGERHSQPCSFLGVEAAVLAVLLSLAGVWGWGGLCALTADGFASVCGSGSTETHEHSTLLVLEVRKKEQLGSGAGRVLVQGTWAMSFLLPPPLQGLDLQETVHSPSWRGQGCACRPHSGTLGCASSLGH